jgi:hypothetical protein
MDHLTVMVMAWVIPRELWWVSKWSNNQILDFDDKRHCFPGLSRRKDNKLKTPK